MELIPRKPRTWDATAYWQGAPGPFEPAALVSTEPNRWNAHGVPTVYLAGDVGLALVEAGRHLAGLSGTAMTRAVWRADIRAPGIVDMRGTVHGGSDTAQRLWILDRARCRRIASELRKDEAVLGLVVPSAGSLDDPSRWNLVLFVDRLAVRLEVIIREAAIVGRLELGASREGMRDA
jgi:RES domain-containing protein